MDIDNEWVYITHHSHIQKFVVVFFCFQGFDIGLNNTSLINVLGTFFLFYLALKQPQLLETHHSQKQEKSTYSRPLLT